MWLGVIRFFGFILLSVIPASPTKSCHQIEFFAAEGYKEKKIKILYDERYRNLADRIACSLRTLHPLSIDSNTTLRSGQKLMQVCGNPAFFKHLSPLHLTVTITDANWLEEMCAVQVAVLHMKKLGNKWVAHILTKRANMIIPLSYMDKAIDDKHLALIVEAVALAWGPVFFIFGGKQYKIFETFKFIEQAVKKKIYLVPVIVVAMVFCVAVVCAGTYCARRRKANAERRAIQNLRAELLSEWGQPFEDFLVSAETLSASRPALRSVQSNTEVNKSPESSPPGSNYENSKTPLLASSNAQKKKEISLRESLNMM